MSFSYQMEQKTFIGVNYTNNWEKGFFATAIFEDLCVVTFQTEYENLYIIWSVCVLFTFP